VDSARGVGTGGGSLRGARPLLLAGAVLAAAIIAVNALAQWDRVNRPCTPGACIQPQLTDAAAGSLGAVGLDLAGYAGIALAFSLANAAAAIGLALLVGWRAERPATSSVPFVFLLLAVLPGTGFGAFPLLDAALRVAGTAGLFWLLATFPRARFEPRWMTVPVVVAALWAVVTALPPISAEVAAGHQPWTTLYGMVFALAVLVIVGGQVARFRRGERDERRRLGLVVVVLAVLVAVGATWSAFAGMNPDTAGIGTLPSALVFEASALIVLLLLAAIGVSVVRDGAFGVEAVVNRVLAGTIAVLLAGAVYAATVAMTSVVLSATLADGGWLPQACGAVLTALVLAVLLGRINRWIDRVVYGSAADPAALVNELVQLLPEARSPAQLLAELAEVTRVRLRLPALCVQVAGVEAADTATKRVVVGDPNGHGPGTVIQLGGAGAPLGTLWAWPRPGQRMLTRRDLRALGAAGEVLVVAATAARLTRELDRSRARLGAARAEERLALSRQLHDELAPTLAVTRHRVNAAQRDAADAPLIAAAHLVAAEQSLADAALQVRALSHALRPPDPLGGREAGEPFGHALAAAVERFAAERDIAVLVTAQIECRLADGIELAAFRIVTEALTNVGRHAGASRTEVTITASGRTLLLGVSDDGRGPGGTPGVGLASMRERAIEWGGYLTFGPGIDGGSTLRCEIPLGGGVDLAGSWPGSTGLRP
jgi:signal transduction histidine kinase